MPHAYTLLTRSVLSIFVILATLPGTGSAWAQVQLSPDSVALQRLRTWAVSLQTGPLASNGIVSLSVRRVNDGAVIFGQNDQISLSTASTLKLVSTATALATLGGTYSYTTTLEYDGVIVDSTLQGNLYLRGTGDPSLGSGRFTGYPAWAALLKDISWQVRRAGIRRIDGAIIGDASYYTDQPIPDSWPFSDLGNYYGAGLFGLNFNENLYRIYFKAGPSLTAPASVLRTDPAMPNLSFNNRVTTGPANSGDEVNIYGAPFQTMATLDGTIPANSTDFAVKGAMPDPAYFTAYAITEQLRRDSVRVAGSASTYRGIGSPVSLKNNQSPRIEVARYLSPPLSDLVRETNFQSINLYAEALMRSAARQIRQVPANWPESISAVTGFWQTKGVTMAGFRPRDGSGLSTTGAMTTTNLTSLLAAMTREAAYPAFYASIPVVGQTGTVRGLAKGTKAAGNVRAKSGTIEGVRAYAGYFTATDGTLMCFSFMVNKYAEGKYGALTPQIERLFTLLVGL
ncbi:D-alanyl-D-alanine carboxypeptidase/D-alanyl-D-alanine endopeptidase [Fibrivirga algicola]|uniref:D-alanyl-D-alanine carboxypeptidase/D-alanyl-D-alanine-endopeptidase n=1 Tax=Fibrivirga algicola TaxID=2950420 RepID=A0ABX0QA07_9BACT|nr:D-alanyl-D-alanine carboxypeptidase/D-alanyl-D-alanine-endopeptidase [Fibrivirga algicola]NID08764.1 D-alanyl-D-alanine carboxypeptidase/D-alanyl-D-alanine-endopeptidase [Fibrivirga algicola]